MQNSRVERGGRLVGSWFPSGKPWPVSGMRRKSLGLFSWRAAFATSQFHQRTLVIFLRSTPASKLSLLLRGRLFIERSPSYFRASHRNDHYLFYTKWRLVVNSFAVSPCWNRKNMGFSGRPRHIRELEPRHHWSNSPVGGLENDLCYLRWNKWRIRCPWSVSRFLLRSANNLNMISTGFRNMMAILARLYGIFLLF